MRLMLFSLVITFLLSACSSEPDNFKEFWADNKDAGLTGAWAYDGQTCSQSTRFLQFKDSEVVGLVENKNRVLISTPKLFTYKSFRSRSTADGKGLHFSLYMKTTHDDATWLEMKFVASSKNRIQFLDAVGAHEKDLKSIANQFNLTRCFDV